MPSILSKRLVAAELPSPDASIAALVDFAHTFDGYSFWRSTDRCADVANARDHSSIDTLRTCLFFEVRRWRHFGEDPDDEALTYWRELVELIRQRIRQSESEDIEWLIESIRRLPSDEPVPDRTPGYNKYNTQKNHWLGWLDPSGSTGTYPRRTGNGKGIREIYNRIVEPKMLLWLIRAAGVKTDLTEAAASAAEGATSLAGKSAAIRRLVPWAQVAKALRESNCRSAA